MIAYDPLSLVFIFCFLLGLGFFLLAILLGGQNHVPSGHLHVHLPGTHHAPVHMGSHTQAHAPSTGAHSSGGQQGAQGTAHLSLLAYLNPTSLALFLFGFGFFGYFFHNITNLAVALTLFLAAGGGLAIAALLLMTLNRLFAGSEGSTELDVVDRTGMLGRVSITIPAEGIGEIIYTSPGGVHKSIPARGLEKQRLERDQEVVVVNYQSGVAEVDTWEHFIQEERRTPPDQDALDELARLRSLLNESQDSELDMVMRQQTRQTQKE